MPSTSERSKNLSLIVALFDMDGVIFQGKNFWLDLHRAYNTEKEALELAAQLMEIDYRKMSRITVEELWKGKSSEPLMNLVRERQYEAGVPELFEFLHSQKIKTGIVSSGPLQLAARAQDELGIDEIRANYVHIKDGHIAGVVDVNVSENEKGPVGLELISIFKGEPRCTLFVGDEPSDRSLAIEAGLPIAYNCTDDVLKDASKYILPRGRLIDVIQIINKWRIKELEGQATSKNKNE